MRRVLGLVTVAGMVAVGAPTLAPARPSSPAVRVVALQPLTVHGQGFRAGERLSVVLVLDGRHVRVVRSNRRGSFVARFEEYANLCMAFTLRAMHGTTVRAAARHRPPPSCAALDPVP